MRFLRQMWRYITTLYCKPVNLESPRTSRTVVGHIESSLPDGVVTVDSVVKKHLLSGRAEKLAAARKLLASRMGGSEPATIQEARLKKGLSQNDLATRIGTSQPRIARLEAGREDNPGLKTLRALSDALDLDMNAVSKLFK